MCMHIPEFKIAVGHRPFSGHFLTKIGYFRQYVKVFSPFSDHLITKNPQNYIKRPYTFVNGQTLVEVFSHLPM